jgi:N-formylglutamate amidohydrolase
VRAEVSRLVVDVERFADDSKETMSAVGMGAVYLRTHKRSTLRHSLSDAERNALISDWYTPHHTALTSKVDMALARFGKCLVVDCHSFSSVPRSLHE